MFNKRKKLLITILFLPVSSVFVFIYFWLIKQNYQLTISLIIALVVIEIIVLVYNLVYQINVNERLEQLIDWGQLKNTYDLDKLKISHNMQRSIKTVMFGDIRGFTKYCDRTETRKVVNVLEGLYILIENTIVEFQGNKPEFIGDEFMTFFNDTDLAIECALKINKEANIYLQQFGLSLGIGIDKGQVLEGVVGGKLSKKYTLIGRAVNVAAKLQASAIAEQILISPTILRATTYLLKVRLQNSDRLKGLPSSYRAYSLYGYSISQREKTKEIGLFKTFFNYFFNHQNKYQGL